MNIGTILLAAAAAATPALREPSPSCRVQDHLPYKLGVARYTMHAQTFDRTLEILQDIDCHYLGLIDKSIARDASDEEIAAYKDKCAKFGVEVVSLGPLYYSTEEELAAACKFAKRYGMKYISVVPFEWNLRSRTSRTPRSARRYARRASCVSSPTG